METRDKEHFLALKVMRLTRPSLYSTQPVASDSEYFTSDLLNKSLKSDLASSQNLECFISGNLLMLPQSFGNIYLGETFSCYMSVHNDSLQTVSHVSVQADLQIGLQKILLTGHRGNYSSITQLGPNESVDDVIHHEVKETGTHILACTVSKPLDVKTKFYNAEDFVHDDVYLEAPIQNITYSPMCLEKVVLEPSMNFNAQQLNNMEDEEGTFSVFGEVNCLNQLDTRQYLFCLTPKPESRINVKLLQGVTSIGKLDIVWRTGMGERGRLQTSQLERVVPSHDDVLLSIEEIPGVVPIEKPFPVTFRFTNGCNRVLDLLLTLQNSFANPIMWHGISGQKFEKMEPRESVVVSLEAIALKPGLQMICGVRITDLFLKRLYEYDEIAQIFVTKDKTIKKNLSKFKSDKQ